MRRWVALTAVGVLLAGAGAYGATRGDGDSPDAPPALSERVVELQGRAAMQPCPAGLGPALPDLTVRCLGGGDPVRLRGPLTGGPTVLNVWGSWCGPCVAEVPGLIRFARERAGQVAVVGVNTADVDEFALDFAVRAGMRYPSVVDEGAEISLAFGQGVPKTVFLAADGQVRHVVSGELSYERLNALTDRYLP